MGQEPRRDDDPRTDDELRTGAPPQHPLQGRLLRAAFQDLFGRPPLAEERERWGGRGVRELLDAIEAVDSPEAVAFWNHWFEEQLYYFFLIDNFRPASERVLAAPADLAAGRIGVQDAIHRIALCSAFNGRNPGADTFVTVVMEQLLGITVREDRRELEVGKVLYDGGNGTFLDQRGNSQADVVRIAIEDRRFLRRLVEREYRRIVRGDPSGREISGWARELDKGPLGYLALVREWMLGPAYAARLEAPVVQPNRLFVQSLHVDLLDRVPDVDEARRLREALDGLSDPGPLRAILARLVIDSGEAAIPSKDSINDPTRWVAGLFERWLAREARPEELKAFVTAFHDPASRPETLVYAIVSSPEYHRY